MTIERRVFKDREEALEALADELTDLIWSDHAQGYTDLADDWGCQVLPECDPATADEELYGRWANITHELITDALIIVVARSLGRHRESYEKEVNNDQEETQDASPQS